MNLDPVEAWKRQLDGITPYVGAAQLLGDGLQVTLYFDADGKVMPAEVRAKARVAKSSPKG